jgi:hypothetical protein
MRVKKAKRRPGRQEFIPDVPVQAAPYGARLRAKLDAPQNFGTRKLPPSVTDAVAERKISGGFNTARKNLSKCCNVARAVNGACGLCGGKK